MGRAIRWLRSFLGGKKEAKQALPFSSDDTKQPKADESKKTGFKEKRRWSFGKSYKDRSTAPIAAEPKASYNENYVSEIENEQNKHAIAVAVATAAAADAAVAAAQAAAAVVQLTSNGFSLLSGGNSREEFAAIRIQTAFRGYLARKALYALKGLVKLQALVRGHFVRKQAAATLRCMQALVRVQARVRARRVRMSGEGQAVQMKLLQRRQQESRPRKSAEGWNASTASAEELEVKVQSRQAAAMKRQRALSYAFSQQHWGSTWLDRWMPARPWVSPDVGDLGGQGMEGSNLDESSKIVEMDTSRPKSNSKKWIGSMRESVSVEPSMLSNTAATQYPGYGSWPPPACFPSCSEGSVPPELASHMTSHPAQLSIPKPASDGTATLACQDFSPASLYTECAGGEESIFSTAQSSPQFSSAVSKNGGRRGPFTPSSKSEYAESFFNGYSAFPNYMANTESSRAKVRSHSAPKQRPDPSEKSVLSSKKRMSLQGAMENRSTLSGVRMQRSSSQVRATNQGYHYIGPIRLDRSTTSLRDSEFDTASIATGDY